MIGQKVLGVLGGSHMTPSRVAQWIQNADIVVAADSGFLRALEAGYVPDIVVGDFDSVSVALMDDDIEIVHEIGQDDTDCAKLLNYVSGKGARSVTLICAEGDLTDHFIDTIHSAVRSDLHVSIGLERGTAYILKGPIEKSFQTTPGKRLSLLPLETVSRASLVGVRWSFENQELSVRGFTSISNETIDSLVSVSFESGSAYLFIEDDGVTPFQFPS